jgi:hypothetical protein
MASESKGCYHQIRNPFPRITYTPGTFKLIKLKQDLMKNELHDWIFHFNVYTNNWEAAKREHYVYLFSDRGAGHVISSHRIDVLTELIIKTKGDISKMNALTIKPYKK